VSLYDFIIAGGGASGLALAYHMAQSHLRGQSILIAERDAKDRNDRSWSFWSEHPTRFNHLAYRTWDQIEFISDDFQKVYDTRPYQYRMIRGIDFYEGMREALAGIPGITLQRGRVTDVCEAPDKKGAQVVIDAIPQGSRYAFDSIFTLKDVITGPKGYHYLKQHFKGWEIETSSDCFDPLTVTLFDFRTPQKGCMRFFYILPFSRRRALVEYTLFSADLLKPHEYDRALADYIENTRGIARYNITETETGVIPMTDRPFPRKLSPHVLAIGTKGGLVKPSSGYGFLRFQQDAANIVSSLVSYGHPFQIPAPSRRYRLLDTVMLQVMYRNGDRMKEIFTSMFRNNDIQTIFRFLDEVAPPLENLKIINSVPKQPFIKALFRAKLLRKI
jgi:lycopene beta-cyclase